MAIVTMESMAEFLASSAELITVRIAMLTAQKSTHPSPVTKGENVNTPW
jgi:hypothetical protein